MPIHTSTRLTTTMDISTFITNYREAFGAHAPLPLLFRYDDTPIAETEKTNGCFSNDSTMYDRDNRQASTLTTSDAEAVNSIPDSPL